MDQSWTVESFLSSTSGPLFNCELKSFHQMVRSLEPSSRTTESILKRLDNILRSRIRRLLYGRAMLPELLREYEDMRRMFPPNSPFQQYSAKCSAYAELLGTHIQCVRSFDPDAALGLLFAGEVLDLVKESGNGITEKEIRRQIRASNVGLILWALESHGLVVSREGRSGAREYRPV